MSNLSNYKHPGQNKKGSSLVNKRSVFRYFSSQMKKQMKNNAKIIGFVTAALTLAFVVQIQGLNAKSDHESQLAQEARLLAKSFRNDDAKIGKCRSLSENLNSENVTSCIEKAVESNNKDLALLNKVN